MIIMGNAVEHRHGPLPPAGHQALLILATRVEVYAEAWFYAISAILEFVLACKLAAGVILIFGLL